MDHCCSTLEASRHLFQLWLRERLYDVKRVKSEDQALPLEPETKRSNPNERTERQCTRDGNLNLNWFKFVYNRGGVYLTLISLYLGIPSTGNKKETTLHRAHHTHTRDKQAPTHFPLPSS